MEDCISNQLRCGGPSRSLQDEIKKLVGEMRAKNVQFPPDVLHAVDSDNVNFTTMLRVSETILFNYYKAAVVCNSTNSAAGTIPSSLRTPAYDAFIPNHPHNPLRSMLAWQMHNYPDEYALGEWPPRRTRIKEFEDTVKPRELDNGLPAVQPYHRGCLENGEAVGLGPRRDTP